MLEGLGKFKLLRDSTMLNLWNDTDPHQCAKIYLQRIMQSQCFTEELAYLTKSG